MQQVILNILATKDLSNKIFNYVDLWSEILEYIAWAIRDYYHHTIQATPGQAAFVRDMIFNPVSVIYWQVIITGKQKQTEIDNL